MSKLSRSRQEHLELLQKHFCENLEDEACEELIEVLKTDKDCRIYYDTVKKTVVLCREKDCPEDLPQDINERLFKILGLEKYKNLNEME